jgi:hypothetical protein
MFEDSNEERRPGGFPYPGLASNQRDKSAWRERRIFGRCRTLGLTKFNYNACKIGDAAPVTVGFSNAVRAILVSNPTIKNPRPNFKFYI